MLAQLFAALRPGTPPPGQEDYLVVGTVEKAAWKESQATNRMSIEAMLANLHDFKEVVTFKLVGGWGKW